MILIDVNVLVNAFREAAPEHAAYRAWLTSTIAKDEPFALSELVLSGFVRIATHPRVFDPPHRLPRRSPSRMPFAPNRMR